MKKISRKLIAPCGMDCGVCMAYLREKNTCPGCYLDDSKKSKSCLACRIKNCKKREGKYCFNCSDFPCERLRHLDKRYRTKYTMSEIDNLEFIRDHGINNFVDKECKRWQSQKGTFCVHNKKYYK